jgi:hypothetical protein
MKTQEENIKWFEKFDKKREENETKIDKIRNNQIYMYQYAQEHNFVMKENMVNKKELREQSKKIMTRMNTLKEEL